MFWGNQTYGDKADTPVPLKTYRCHSTGKEKTRAGRTHYCKVVTDHPGDHECICGKTWKRGV